jgi:molecular chaperone GrpE
LNEKRPSLALKLPGLAPVCHNPPSVGESDRRDSSGNPRPEPIVQADVSDEVIQAALRSVEGGGTSEESGPENAGGTSKPSVVRGVGAPDDSGLEGDGLKAELRETRAALDVSMERARETMNRLKDSHDRHLRAAADLENYKKRALREREEVERFGTQKLLKDLLPVMDNLERALEHADASNVLTEGVVATRRLFEEVLGRYGVKAFTTVGQPFDPNQHEAMQRVVTSEVAPGTVVTEPVRGYTLNGRLVRPALVSVASAPPEPQAPPDADPGRGAPGGGDGA